MNKFREFRHNASQKPEFYSQKNFFNISQGSNNKELGKNFIK